MRPADYPARPGRLEANRGAIFGAKPATVRRLMLVARVLGAPLALRRWLERLGEASFAWRNTNATSEAQTNKLPRLYLGVGQAAGCVRKFYVERTSGMPDENLEWHDNLAMIGWEWEHDGRLSLPAALRASRLSAVVWCALLTRARRVDSVVDIQPMPAVGSAAYEIELSRSSALTPVVRRYYRVRGLHSWPGTEFLMRDAAGEQWTPVKRLVQTSFWAGGNVSSAVHVCSSASG